MHKQHKKEETKHKKKHINHDPKEESTKAVFGDPKAHDDNHKDFTL